ncbi:hypothetical protein N8I77_002843 [Diaporthe amygdali]|uniref:Beta-lactamase-related domain-containing protein n=1 Tax=Phomopsis amygdali TaxID=1214568 RepID=A0AAD9STJ1_PHOAM|nr:hypothetical protein N8I77_002843 [Diaporthe amygdali]
MDKLDSIMAMHAAQGWDTNDKLLGVSFMVVDEKDVLYEGSAGRIGHHHETAKYTPDTFTYVASLTKLPTAICLLQLVERGQVSLDEDLRPRIPFLSEVQILRGFDENDQPILEDNHRPITLWHLLTHTSGLTYDIPSEPLMKWRQAVGRHKNNLTWTEEGFSTPLLFEPGTQWLYGTGIDWAGQLLEQVTGQTLEQYMRANIFGVLGMRDSGFRPKLLADQEERAARTASFSFRSLGGALEAGPSPLPNDHPLESGGAGLFTTARDYAKLLQAVLQGKLLSKEGMNLLFRPQLDEGLQKDLMEKLASAPEGYAPEYPIGMPANFALGGMLNMEDIPGKRKAGSMMWSGMANSHWWIDPSIGVAGVFVVTLLPYADHFAANLYSKLETAVYEDLVAGRPVGGSKTS